jgi:hypothetical protein
MPERFQEEVEMKFKISVIDSTTRSPHSAEEIAAIDEINLYMSERGYRVLAVGMEAPESATVFDNRGNSDLSHSGAFQRGEEFVSGFWVVDVPSEAVAIDLAKECSKACNRKVELRKIIG